MDIMADQNFDVLGHNFLDTIDLDVMEQTIIDDVMAEITVSEQITMTEPLITRSKSEPVIIEVPIPRTRSEPVLKDVDSEHVQLKDVIEAVDVEGLLEQFEEVSQNLDNKVVDEVKTDVPVFTLHTSVQHKDVKDKNGNIEKKELSSDVLQRLKSSSKPKSAVMLPMMVPAKRGRGRAMTRGHPVALPANCTPRRLQRVMMQNAELKDSIALEEEKEETNTNLSNGNKVVSEKVANIEPEVRKKEDNSKVDQNYFEHFSDHDYFKSSGTRGNSACDMKDSVQESENNLDIEDGEIVDEDGNKDKSRSLRLSKSRENLSEDRSDPAQFFDKLPSYYTALSIPRKQVRKTASCVTGRGGITVNDYFERDISPVRDPSTYSKLPEYCSSFTNSTKYDSLLDRNSQKSNDSKASSGYSSPTNSPDLSIRPSRSASQSLSRSRSRSCSASRSVQRNYRQRKSSYSSCSGYSSSGSSCSRSSCSDSSCCGSNSRSGSCNSSRSLPCSTCGSRSSSMSSRSPSRSPTRSPERSWRRERDLREERSRRTRSRSNRRSRPSRRLSRRSRSVSRLYSYSRSRSREYRSRSRSRSRRREIQRQRDESRERWREERRKQKEEEKEQQMKERRIVYVGGLPSSYSRHQLKDHFSRFGPIENVQLHFRECGDNYGFVTFRYTCDAFAAIEKGNRVPALAKFDLCFGGRRQFCDVEYADLDGNKEVEEEFDSKLPKQSNMDFDELLRQAKAGIKRS